MAQKKIYSVKKTAIGPIPADWELKQIHEFCLKVTSGGTPSRTKPEYWQGGTIPWLKTQELTDGSIYRSEEKITQKGMENSSAKLLPKGTILMAMYGATVGKLGILRIEAATNQAFCALSLDPKVAETQFLFYALLDARKKLINLATGAAQQNLSQDVIKKFIIPSPPLPEQRAIAKVLSDLDSKIELNDQMNKTLEAIGQALFKHWFIDFEFPNEQGKPYKSSGGKMVDSELGKIPKGWTISKIGDEFQTILGGTPSREKAEYWTDGTVAWINSGKVNEFRVIAPSEYITETAVEKSAAKLMPKRTTLIAITGATLGQVSLLEIESCGNQSIIGILESELFKAEYVYYLINYEMHRLIASQTGGAQQHINKNDVNSMTFIKPEEKVLKRYYEHLHHLMNKITTNCFQIKQLSQIRDSLLPKLMSGQIRVHIHD